MATLSQLPPPPKGQTGVTLDQLKGLPPPPKGQTGMTLDQITSPREPNYFQRVGQDYMEGAQDIVSSAKTATQAARAGNPLEFIKGAARTGLRAVGGVAKTAFSPIVEAPGIKQGLEAVGTSVSKIPGVDKIVGKVKELSDKHPEIAKDLQNIVDIATLGGGAVAEKPALKAGEKVLETAGKGVKMALTPSEGAVKSKIETLFQKSIKPTAKKTLSQDKIYRGDIVNALKTIKNNVSKLNIEDSFGEIVSRAPESINEFAQSIDQTKKAVFKQYNALAQKAGEAGAKIDVSNVVNELGKVAKNKALQITNPEVLKYAQGWVDRLKDVGNIDAEVTQNIVQNMNESLKSFYRNPTYESASKVAIDAGIANNFRQALDEVIEKSTGQQYQALKKQYGSLKAIENDVVRAATREARKNTKVLLDYTDIFTGSQMLTGVLSLNPALFAKGAVERAGKEYIKFLNDPNRAIKTIFKKVDRLK